MPQGRDKFRPRRISRCTSILASIRTMHRVAKSLITMALATLVGTLEPAAASAVPTDVRGPWVSLGDGPQYAPPLRYRPSPYPHTGVSVFASDTGADVSTQCTVSWPVRDGDGDYGFLTAGHCAEDGSEQLWIRDRSGRSIDLPPLTAVANGEDGRGIRHDSAIFYLPGGATLDDTMVAPGVNIRGALSVEEINWLPRGTIMCMNGARSGISCGPFERAYADVFEWHGSAVHGDSGAPLFVVNGNGDALAVGMLTGGPTDTLNYATYLMPVLQRDGLRLVTGS